MARGRQWGAGTPLSAVFVCAVWDGEGGGGEGGGGGEVGGGEGGAVGG